MDESKTTGPNPTNNSANKLSGESSPYLLQHAFNPVNWYPWGPEAIELARKQDKPILLSIGYSACHWCHVMLHESFEDPDVAATMNRLFINIKVDKEERQDLDKIYQTAHQLLMGHAGGWPLTLFLSPTTLMPYYAGTYFPKKSIAELPDFQTLMHKLNDVYFHDKEKISIQEAHIHKVLQVIAQPRLANESPFAECLRHDAELVLQNEFDPINSGFGDDAKFPSCPTLDFLLESNDPLIRHMPLATLKHMAESGICDHLAGGFFRYTVDPEWQIPHFEKMIYDNGQLLNLYAKAFAQTDNELYKQTILTTANWITAVMLDPATGGYYTSIDADSEQQEGLYYIWDKDEIKQLLTSDEYSSIKKYYMLDQRSNFEDKWHLIINTESRVPDAESLSKIKHKLLQQRNTRSKPTLDTKILTGWNGLVISGLSKAGQALQMPDLLSKADTCITFIKNKLYVEQHLFATYQNNTPKVFGFLDDYAFVLAGILCFIGQDPNHRYIPFCLNLADSLIDNFYDQQHGGFFFCSHKAEKLFYNPKIYTDDATPSGNGIACQALIQLSRLIKNERYMEVAKHSLQFAQVFLNEAPEVHLSMLTAYAMLHKD